MRRLSRLPRVRRVSGVPLRLWRMRRILGRLLRFVGLVPLVLSLSTAGVD
jgi:hypothetical protein